MDTKLLKQKILDLAIRGKLVPQDPNDEPASVLLERIRAEREQLIKQGKLKRSKSTSDNQHYQNVPFEVPASWEWVRLEDLFKFHQGIQVDKDKQLLIQKNGYVRFLRIIDYTQSTEQPRYVRDPGLTYYVMASDLVMIRYGSPGTSCMGYEGVIANNLFRIIPIVRNTIFNRYAYFFFLSSYFQFYCRAQGVALSAISFTTINKIKFPLPPLTEQQRIVAEIEKWIALIDEIEANKQDLQEYIKQTKSKVLDLAIHGKLVPQDPNDEPAIELLRRINPSFKPCDTSHYENLPEGWTVLTVGEVADYINGRAFKPTEWEQKGLPIIRIQNLNDEDAAYNYSTAKFEDKYLVHKGDLLSAWAASLGTYIWQKDDAWLNQHIFKVIPKPFISRNFLYYSFINMIDDFYAESHGSGMVHITKGKFETRPILIPPIAEQKRIVERIETIFASLDTITAEL